MKSLLFTHFEKELLDLSKQRTFRCIFTPNYDEKEYININFKKENGTIRTLYSAKVLKIYPIQIKNVGLHEAKLDGFDSIYAFRKGILKINHVKSLSRWGFFTLFTRVKSVFDFGTQKNEEVVLIERIY